MAGARIMLTSRKAADLEQAVATLQDRVARLRELSPLWEMYKDGVDLSSIQWAAH